MGAKMTEEAAHDSAMIWGLRSSFLTYVRGVGGTVETSGADWLDAENGFVFPLEGANDGVRRFGGVVALRAHGGLLDVELRDPWVTVGPEAGQLTAELKGAPGRIVVAELRFAEDGSSAQACLHGDACFLFDFTYGPGTPLDDLRFTPSLERALTRDEAEEGGGHDSGQDTGRGAEPNAGRNAGAAIDPGTRADRPPAGVPLTGPVDALRRIPFFG